MQRNNKLCFTLRKLQKHTKCLKLLREIKFYLKPVPSNNLRESEMGVRPFIHGVDSHQALQMQKKMQKWTGGKTPKNTPNFMENQLHINLEMIIHILQKDVGKGRFVQSVPPPEGWHCSAMILNYCLMNHGMVNIQPCKSLDLMPVGFPLFP